MAMISLKNLVAPVSNTVHLVSIVFVVLLFGFWRWSGGELNIVRPSSRGGERRPAVDQRVDLDSVGQRRPSGERLPQRGVVSVPKEAADDLLDSMLAPDGSTVERREAPARPTRGRSANALDDIERSLGLK